jgi:hypothetical protein
LSQGGSKDVEIVIQAIRQGLPVPRRIAEAPDLLPWLRFEFEAFFELITCSNDGGVIPWTAINAYAQAYGMTSEEDIYRFTKLMRAMDKVYVAYRNKKRDLKSKTAKAGKKGVGKQ